MFWKILFGALFFYFLLRFIFRFVLPIIRVTRKTQAAMSEMRRKMQEMEQQQHQQQQSSRVQQKAEGEYIDYEEIK